MASARQQLMMLLGVPPSQKPSPKRLLDLAERQLARSPDDVNLQSLMVAYRGASVSKRPRRTAPAAESSDSDAPLVRRAVVKPEKAEPPAEPPAPIKRQRGCLLRQALYDLRPDLEVSEEVCQAVENGDYSRPFPAAELGKLTEAVSWCGRAYIELLREMSAAVPAPSDPPAVPCTRRFRAGVLRQPAAAVDLDP